MRRSIVIAVAALSVAGCGNKGNPDICRPVTYTRPSLTPTFTSQGEAQEALRQCLINYSYLLAKDGGAAAAVAGAVKASCDLEAGQYANQVTQEFRAGRDYGTIPLEQRQAIASFINSENARLYDEIPNYIVEAKAGDCRP